MSIGIAAVWFNPLLRRILEEHAAAAPECLDEVRDYCLRLDSKQVDSLMLQCALQLSPVESKLRKRDRSLLYFPSQSFLQEMPFCRAMQVHAQRTSQELKRVLLSRLGHIVPLFNIAFRYAFPTWSTEIEIALGNELWALYLVAKTVRLVPASLRQGMNLWYESSEMDVFLDQLSRSQLAESRDSLNLLMDHLFETFNALAHDQLASLARQDVRARLMSVLQIFSRDMWSALVHWLFQYPTDCKWLLTNPAKAIVALLKPYDNQINASASASGSHEPKIVFALKTFWPQVFAHRPRSTIQGTQLVVNSVENIRIG